MIDVITEIVINETVDKVYDYAVDPDNAPDWYENIRTVEWKGPKQIKIGSKIAFKAFFLGRELAYIYEIVELVKGKTLVMRTADGPFLMETTYIFTPLDDNSTSMTLRNRGNPSGFSILFSPLMAVMMKKANKKDLRKIKKKIESKKM